jgi:type VI secretion system protein ImpF
MARTELERAVQPSLVDRLTDEAPGVTADLLISRDESERRYRTSVRRDLEWLLNTRRTMEPAPAERPELRHSVYDYGLPDTTGVPMDMLRGHERLVAWLEDTIARFEPRLTDVRVRLIEADQVATPQVRFTIEALLRMDPSPELVVFDTVLQVARSEYEIGSLDHA